ncbi:MAG: GNAT family N-acetyltransferase [Clostridia bacterium]|nr:GNAT family N-acetyltransferase [Clostridia bacterium]
MLCACISSCDREDDNLTADSLRFHEYMGFTKVGEHKLCGYKFNKWYDIVWMEKMICERPDYPESFVPFPEINN